jgi:hypothetical protein
VTVIAAISAAGSVVSAVGSFLAAQRTRNAAEASLIRQFIYDYSSDEMRAALQKIREWMNREESHQ